MRCNNKVTRTQEREVLLLEAGGDDDSLFISMPAGVQQVIATKTWNYTSEPDPRTNNRRMSCAQGKVLEGVVLSME
nr:GMC family oxidoreductase N-terminal domain-containing protein [Acinetobacter baumannii]